MVITQHSKLSTPKSRWTAKTTKETEPNTNKWTEVIPKKKQPNQLFTEGCDPFAGMKSTVDYEQEIERLKQFVTKAIPPSNTLIDNHYKKKKYTISRSNSPDTIRSSDSDSTSSSCSSISEQEKVRFLAFIHHWTTDHIVKEFYDHNHHYSLWADQSPYSKSVNSSNLQYYTYWPIKSNHHMTVNRPLPIGVGRKMNNSLK